jgi:hypothetical protein
MRILKPRHHLHVHVLYKCKNLLLEQQPMPVLFLGAAGISRDHDGSFCSSLSFPTAALVVWLLCRRGGRGDAAVQIDSRRVPLLVPVVALVMLLVVLMLTVRSFATTAVVVVFPVMMRSMGG